MPRSWCFRAHAILEKLCAENELVIGHYFLYTLGAAAERHNRPYVSIVLAHGAVPLAFAPPSGAPSLGALSNRLAWRLAQAVLKKALKKYPDRLRANNGVAATRDMVDNVWASDYLILLAISPTICEREPDWPSRYVVCEALDTSDSAAECPLPQELQSFLSTGSPPVYMIFGSMVSGGNQMQTIALLVDAAQAASTGAVIQAPDWEQLGFECGRQIHYLSPAPQHSAIFPLFRAVVHHGGAGTFQAALRAGVPSIIVPHTAEQELGSRELRRIGVPCKPILDKRATPGRIAEAINRAAESRRIAENAKMLGARVAEEEGVATAVRVISDRLAA